ncbi:hypothetical protein FAZ15_16320 [Sphingobacterium olei]|uniref:Uncharacterized protein n=1 Tax=Sphingobacterium olei TaxID=2571155 RepID=A0A4U0NHV0_9SPHI|nr:hypothetical protein FAZ15_16320 [Sphingobacterium olei]
MAIFNSWYYLRGRGEDIVKKRPLLFGSKKLSVYVTLLFFLVTFSWLFWGGIYSRHLFENC